MGSAYKGRREVQAGGALETHGGEDVDRVALSHAERLKREREFHNVRFSGDSDQDAQAKYYWAM